MGVSEGAMDVVTRSFIDVQSLQAARVVLPAYMLPSTVIGVNTWPRNSSNKIDRKRLPLPTSRGLTNNVVAPRTDEEILARNVFATVLRLTAEEISIEANFFELGGTSLSVLQLVRHLSSVLEHEVNVSQVIQGPTIAQLTMQ